MTEQDKKSAARDDAEPKPLERIPGEALRCGIVMPLSATEGCSPAHWGDVQSVITESVESIGEPAFKAEMVSQADYIGIIHKRIVTNLYFNEIVVCDVSCRNPNVMFELGMRLAFDKPVVIIKDDKTDYSFDSGPVEHLEYPRDLRYSLIQIFKRELAAKVLSTYKRHKQDPNATSYLQSFGPIKVANLQTEEVNASSYMISQLENIRSEMQKWGGLIAEHSSGRVFTNHRSFTFTPSDTQSSPPNMNMVVRALAATEAHLSVLRVKGGPKNYLVTAEAERAISKEFPELGVDAVKSLVEIVLERMTSHRK